MRLFFLCFCPFDLVVVVLLTQQFAFPVEICEVTSAFLSKETSVKKRRV